MSSMLIRDTFELTELNALAALGYRIEDVTPISPIRGDTWIVVKDTRTEHTFLYTLVNLHRFVATMKG